MDTAMEALRVELIKAIKRIANNEKASPEEYRALAEIANAYMETFRL